MPQQPVTGLLPAPLRAAPTPGESYVLDEDSRIDARPGTERVARWLRATVGAATGLPLAPNTGEGNHIVLELDPGLGERLGPEGYRIVIDGLAVVVQGGGEPGLFWGAQTLRQLLGPDAFRRAPIDPDRRAWSLPAIGVEDAPRFAWRGMMLTWPATSCPRTAYSPTSTCWPPTSSTCSIST